MPAPSIFKSLSSKGLEADCVGFPSWTSPANSETPNPARNRLAVASTRVPCVRAHLLLAPALSSWQFSWHSGDLGRDLHVQHPASRGTSRRNRGGSPRVDETDGSEVERLTLAGLHDNRVCSNPLAQLEEPPRVARAGVNPASVFALLGVGADLHLSL